MHGQCISKNIGSDTLLAHAHSCCFTQLIFYWQTIMSESFSAEVLHDDDKQRYITLN